MSEVPKPSDIPPPSFTNNESYSDVQELQHDGIYAIAWTAYYEDTPAIIKRYKLPDNLAESLSDLEAYRNDINYHATITGISAPENFAITHDEDFVYFTDASAGDRDVSKLLGDPSIPTETRAQLAFELLTSLAHIPRDNHNQLTYMVDGKISNFCVNSGGGFTYVDLYPAHTRQEQSTLLKPSPSHASGDRNLQLDSFITGDMYGVLGRFVGFITRNHPELYVELRTQLHSSNQDMKLPDDIISYISFLLEDENSFMTSLYTHSNNPETYRQLSTILHPARYNKP